MAGFGELVLVLGDYHVPHRSTVIPEKFKRMLVPNKMKHVICTGNVGGLEQYEELQTLAPNNVHCVQGDFDDSAGSSVLPLFPESTVLQVGQFRIGVIHGHQVLPWNNQDALTRMRRKLNVDILISGHTHENQVHCCEDGSYHINPGSITGAYSTITKNVSPSFVLLAVKDNSVVCYVYKYTAEGEVDVSKTEFTKKEKEAVVQSTASKNMLNNLLS